MNDELDEAEELKALQEELTALKAKTEELTSIEDNTKETEKALTKDERELVQKLAAIREAKTLLLRDREAKQKLVRTTRTREGEVKRRLQKLLDDRRVQSEMLQLSAEFDNRTIGAPWREWARSHQISGAKHLAAAKRAVLGDKRGLGKSLTVLIYLDMIGAKKTLIFTPKDVSLNFQSEVKRWTPNRPVIVLTGMLKPMRDAVLFGVNLMPECTLILNYEAGRKDPSLTKTLIACQFDTVIVDEAHKIKKHTGIDYKSIYAVINAENKCCSCGANTFDSDLQTGKFCTTCYYTSTEFGDFQSVKNVVPMTGTPLINRPGDMWPLLNLIDPVNFGSEIQYLREYCTQNSEGRWVFQWGGEERLTKRLGPKYIGRTNKTAGVEMPPQTAQMHMVEFDPVSYPNQWRIMEQIRQYSAMKFNEADIMGVPGVLAEIIRMSQAITWPGGIKEYEKDENGKPNYKNVIFESDVFESIKIDKAMEIIEQAVEEGDRVILFSRFKEALKEIDRRLADKMISAVRYDGDLPDMIARKAQLDFDIKTAASHSSNEPCNPDCPDYMAAKQCYGYKWDVLLGQYQKAGTGLNLTGARQMVILDRYYAEAYEDQASGRIQRLDSTQETIVHIISITSPVEGKKTIDDWMNDLIEMKKEMADGFNEAHAMSEFVKAMKDGDVF